MASARGVVFARFRVTVVAVVAAAILSVLIYLLTGGTLLQQKVTIYLYVPDATGLSTSTMVRVNGIDVGKVVGVQFSGSTETNRVVRLTLNVQQERLRDIPEDSSAQISSDGAVGDKYLDIAQGRNAARIRPGGEISYQAQPAVLKTEDLQQFVTQLRSVDATLADVQQGRTKVGQLVVGRAQYDDLRKLFIEADRGFRQATSPTSSLGRLVSSDEAHRKITDPVVQFDDQLGRIQAGQGSLGRALREDGEYRHYLDQTAGFRQSIADLRAQPFFALDESYASWNRTLASFVRQVDAVNTSRMFSNSLDYDNLAGFAREMRQSVREFRQDPKKYLRLELF